MGFVFNPDDACAANRSAKEKQHTMRFHADDLMSSHVDKKVNNDGGGLRWGFKTTSFDLSVGIKTPTMRTPHKMAFSIPNVTMQSKHTMCFRIDVKFQ